MTISSSFGGPWPEVLGTMNEWLQNQALKLGRVGRIEIIVSGPMLLAAKRDGKQLAPHFKKFRRTLEKRFAGRIRFAGDETAKTHHIAIVQEDPR